MRLFFPFVNSHEKPKLVESKFVCLIYNEKIALIFHYTAGIDSQSEHTIRFR